MNTQYTKYLFVILLFSSFCRSQKLLLLMMDGFRWDYYENMEDKMPGLTQFIADGVQAQWVEPIFPPETYPTISTISTGVYPENHGIISNYMMNRSGTTLDEKYFNMSSIYSARRHWLQAEPIWITTMKQNIKAYFHKFPMSNTLFEGLLPENAVIYNVSLPTSSFEVFESELDDSLKLLTEDYSLVMVCFIPSVYPKYKQYYNQIDNDGHHFGPDSPQLQESLIKFDKVLQNFISKLETSSIADQLNIIIVSDHGMTKVGENSGLVPVKLTDFINLDYVDRIMNKKSYLVIAAANGYIEKLYRQLKTMPGVDVYKKEEIPDELHFKNNDRVLDILVLARPGHEIIGVSGGKQIPEDGEPSACAGDHGYSNVTDMRAIFYARGPAFKKEYINSPIRIEDEYQIITKVLGMSALPNNGSWARVSSMFA